MLLRFFNTCSCSPPCDLPVSGWGSPGSPHFPTMDGCTAQIQSNSRCLPRDTSAIGNCFCLCCFSLLASINLDRSERCGTGVFCELAVCVWGICLFPGVTTWRTDQDCHDVRSDREDQTLGNRRSETDRLLRRHEGRKILKISRSRETGCAGNQGESSSQNNL